MWFAAMKWQPCDQARSCQRDKGFAGKRREAVASFTCLGLCLRLVKKERYRGKRDKKRKKKQQEEQEAIKAEGALEKMNGLTPRRGINPMVSSALFPWCS